MESVPEYRGLLSPRAMLRRVRGRAVAFEQSCPAALFLLAAVAAVLSVRGNGFPFALIPPVSLLLVWALIPTRDALLRFALPMIPALIAALVWSETRHNFVAEAAGSAGRSFNEEKSPLPLTSPKASSNWSRSVTPPAETAFRKAAVSSRDAASSSRRSRRLRR